MICKNCGKYTSLDWVECPTCGYLHNSSEFTKLLEEYKYYLTDRNFIKARIILEKALKIARYSSKEEQVIQQLDKLNKLIKNIPALETTPAARPEAFEIEKPAANYVKTLVISKSEDAEDRKFGKRKYNKGLEKNNIILFIMLAPAILYFLIFYNFEGKKDFPDSNEHQYAAVETPQNSASTVSDSAEMINIEYRPKIEKLIVKAEYGKITVNNILLKDETVITNSAAQLVKISAKSRALINIGSTYIIAEENTELRIDEAAPNNISGTTVNLKLNKGSIFTDVQKLARNDKFEISASIFTVGVRGTKFLIETGVDTETVYCLKGLITVTDVATGKQNDLPAGMYCSGKPGAQPQINKYTEQMETKLKKLESDIFNSRLGFQSGEDEKKPGDEIVKDRKETDTRQTIPALKKNAGGESASKIRISGKSKTNEDTELTDKVLKKYRSGKADDSAARATSAERKEKSNSELYNFVKEKYEKEYGSEEGRRKFEEDLKSIQRPETKKETSYSNADDTQKKIIRETRAEFSDEKIIEELEDSTER